MFRCPKCKCYRSIRNGSSVIGGAGRGTWFARFDSFGRPNSKLEIRIILLILWTWAKGMSLSMCKSVLQPLVGSCNEIFVDWRNYVRELFLPLLATYTPMGGPGQTVYIDESYMAGRRKYNRGRVLRGNAVSVPKNCFYAFACRPKLY
ncbi:MAG: hypothetical protein GY820_42495 [Gammaproteobacteria bacterium]|nr:hypothetical protein [Gammaproteobacteria bacterium]